MIVNICSNSTTASSKTSADVSLIIVIILSDAVKYWYSYFLLYSKPDLNITLRFIFDAIDPNTNDSDLSTP